MTEFLQQLVNGITWGSVYALIALGYTMVYGILRLINFAHGDVYMLGAFFAFYVTRLTHAGNDPNPIKAVGVLLVSMAGCGLVGFLIERFAYKPVRKSSRLAALITAIGVSLLLENGGMLLFGADPKFFPQIIIATNIPLGMGVTISNQQVIILAVSLASMLGLRFIVLKTKAGTDARKAATRKVRDLIAATSSYEGATGTITLDENRNPKKPIVMIAVKDGKKVFETSIAP